MYIYRNIYKTVVQPVRKTMKVGGGVYANHFLLLTYFIIIMQSA